MPVTPIGWLRLAIKIALIGALVVLVYLVVVFVQVWQASRVDDRRASDAIVVLGAAQYDGRPSPQLAARLDHVVELWKAKIAPRVVVTGGKQPGDRFTEAAASASYLHERGVPESAILREVQGRTSWESLQAAARILHERRLNRVTLVSDPYHDARIRDIADDVGLDAVVSPTHTSPVRGLTELRYLLKETARVAAGRIIGYSRLERHGRIGELVPGLGIMVGLPRRSRARPLARAAPIRG